METLNGFLKGLKLHPSLDPLSHLQFLDDTLLSDALLSKNNFAFKKVLGMFMLALRALINQRKSLIFFFNTLLVIQHPYYKTPWISKGLPSFQIPRCPFA
jgi:hypothetical protein